MQKLKTIAEPETVIPSSSSPMTGSPLLSMGEKGTFPDPTLSNLRSVLLSCTPSGAYVSGVTSIC